jgi:pimeloyl-ACP methyl ester carboxylesterase
MERPGPHPADPVVLVMGLGMPGHLWSPVVDRLAARGTTAHTPDHAGVGARAPDAPRTDMAGLAADLLAVLDERGWGRVHLVGISMGGMVCQELAVRRPDRVRSLGLVATTASALGLAPPTWAAVSAFATERDRARRLGRLLFPPAVRDEPVYRERAARMAAEMAAPATVRAHARAVAGHDVRGRLSTLRMPVLVVKPALDVLIRPSCSEDLARRVRGSRLETLAQAGHGVIAQEPDLLAALFLDHAARAEARI